MKLPFFSQSKTLDPKFPSPQWHFPTCGNIKTLSFRALKDDPFRTFNTAFLDANEGTPLDSFSTITSSSRSFSTLHEDIGDQIETVIRGLRSDRLFFEPERSSNLLLREQEEEQEQEQEQEQIILKQEDDKEVELSYQESELLSMESNNPYEDFKRSMEEMIEAHGLKDWQGLEELLGCYLKINGKNNHGYILGAFIDLLVSLSIASFDASTSITTTSSSSNSSPSSSPLSFPSSSLTTPCLSSILDHGDDNHDDDVVVVVDDDHILY